LLKREVGFQAIIGGAGEFEGFGIRFHSHIVVGEAAIHALNRHAFGEVEDGVAP
jgi:hypothetical protein